MEVLTVSYDPLIGQMVYGKRPLFEPCQVIQPSQIKSYLQQMQRANYKAEHWVTINGTHVKIDGEGKITAGPSTLAGRSIEHLSDFGNKHKDDREHSNATHDEHPLTRAARQASQHANREGQTRDEKVESHSAASHAHELASRARSKEGGKLFHREQSIHHSNQATEAHKEREASNEKPVRSDESGNILLRDNLPRPDWYKRRPSDKPKAKPEENESQSEEPKVERKPTKTHLGKDGQPKKYMNAEEASSHTGLSVGEIDKLREDGKLRGFADKGEWRFKKDELDLHKPVTFSEAAAVQKPAKTPSEKKPGVPGMQQSLLGEDTTGQQQLFNYVPPKKGEGKPKPASISTLEKISDEQKESKQSALPGQRELTERVKETSSPKEVATESASSKKPSKRSSKDLPHQMSQEEYAKSGARTFQTESGHVYSHHEGRTVRVANDVDEYDDRDVRLKNKSDETHYINPKDSKLIEKWQNQPGRSKRIIRENGEITLTSVNPKTRVRQMDHRIKIESSEPQVGLAPVELSGKSKEGEGWFKNHHPGDTITSMTNPRESHDDFVQAAKEKKETEARAKESATAANNKDSKRMKRAIEEAYERLIAEYQPVREVYDLAASNTRINRNTVRNLGNSDRDYTNLRRFDEAADEFASAMRPGERQHMPSSENSQKLMDVIAAGPPKKPTRNSPEVRAAALELLNSTKPKTQKIGLRDKSNPNSPHFDEYHVRRMDTTIDGDPLDDSFNFGPDEKSLKMKRRYDIAMRNLMEARKEFDEISIR